MCTLSDASRLRRMAWQLAAIAAVMALAGGARMWPPAWMLTRCGDILRLREAFSMFLFAPVLVVLLWCLFETLGKGDRRLTIPFVVGIYFLACGMGMHDPMNLVSGVYPDLQAPLADTVRFFDDALGHWVFWTGFLCCLVSAGIQQIRHPLQAPMTTGWTAFYVGVSAPVAFVMVTNLIWERTAGDVAVVAVAATVIAGYHLHRGGSYRRLPVLCVVYPASAAAVGFSLLFWMLRGYR